MLPSSETEAKIKGLRDFGVVLCRSLAKCIDGPSINNLISELLPHTRFAEKLCQKRLSAHTSVLNKLDQSAIDLWNLASRLLRDKHHGSDIEETVEVSQRRQLLAKATTFAFQLLDLARWYGGTEVSTCVPVETQLGIYKISLSAARICIDASEVESCVSVFKRSVTFSESLSKRELTHDQNLTLKKYNAEYFVLRTSLSSKQGRLDVADHMYDKSKPLLQSLDPMYSENLAEVILGIGRDLVRKKNYKLGVSWLKRAYDVISLHDIHKLSRLGVEQRLTIIHTLVRGYLLLNTLEDRESANDLVCQLERELGDVPATLLLRIHVLKAAPVEEFDIDKFGNTLERFSQIPNLTESQFKTVLHETKTLKETSPLKALSIARTLLHDSSIISKNTDWISKSLIIVVWIYATLEQSDIDYPLSNTIDSVFQSLQTPVDSMTAGAIQSVLWKRIEASITNSQFSLAEDWCNVALHPLFENGGLANQGKLGRKLIYCALENSDFEKAREIFHGLPEPAKKEQATSFLMFKVATRSKDNEFAAMCLQNVAHDTKAGRDILYACVMDSQHTGNLDTAILAMRHLMKVNESMADSNIHVPSLMRCSIRLLYQKFERGNVDEKEVTIEHMCEVFETASTAISKFPKDAKGGKLFPIQELDWFNQNSYNTALKHVETCQPMLVYRLMKVCLQIIEFYPQDISISASHDLSLKRLCGNFVSAAALIAIARAEQDIKEKHQAYLNLRKHVAAYNEELEARKDTYELYIQKDLLAKLSVLHVFDFEAAASQKQWEDMRAVVGRSVVACSNLEMLKGMGDFILSVPDIPSQERYSILQIIVNEIWKLERFNSSKLAKYLRCLFQVVLPCSEDLALETLDNVLNIAKDSTMESATFPPDELEWITITAFNHATDHWSSGNDDVAKKWFEKALSLSHYRMDDGVFEAHLHERLTKLQWN